MSTSAGGNGTAPAATAPVGGGGRQMKTSLLIPILMVVLAGSSLASMDAIGKTLAREMPVIQVVWGRYFFHTLIVFAVLARRGRFTFLASRRPWLQGLRAVLLLSATLFMYTGLRFVPLADATAIQFFAPVLVTLLAAVVLNERLTAARLLAVLTGFIGVLVIVRPGAGTTDWHAALPLGAAVCLAGYYVTTRMLQGTDGDKATLFYTTAAGSLILSLLMPTMWQTPDFGQLAMMVAMGALGATGHFLLVTALGLAPASALSPFLYAQLAAAAVLGVTVFDDVPSIWLAVGTLLIVGGGITVWRTERR